MFNRKILLLHDIRVILMNQRIFTDLKTEMKCKITRDRKIEMVTIVQFKAGLILFAVGCFLSFCQFLREMGREIRKRLVEILVNMD